jgi:23S rRNA (cytidine1920-2'-O)/16S rRNA (cytidine1409-2'-O)-methyltransferase
VLLERGVSQVIALDVGHDQLAASIRADDRVVCVEGCNARYLTRSELVESSGVVDTPTIVVADLSFISLPMVLPALVESVGLECDYIVLVKPQFEVGRTGIREGIVRLPGLREDAINGVLWAAWDLGLGTAGVVSSPIAGNAGNREYLVWLNAEVGTNPTEWSRQVSAIA